VEVVGLPAALPRVESHLRNDRKQVYVHGRAPARCKGKDCAR
jgi:hypothetical protein